MPAANINELHQLELPWFGSITGNFGTHGVVQKYSPSIIFLMEARSKESFLKKLCSKLHIENVLIVPHFNTWGVLLFIGGMVLISMLCALPQPTLMQ